MELHDLGYDGYFEKARLDGGLSSYPVARVIAEHRGLYRVSDGADEFTAKVTGKRMFTASSREDYPAVGDWVAYENAGPGQAVIRAVLPRRTVLKRKESGGSDAQVVGTNIDVAFIVQAVGRDFNINRFERYAAAIVAGGVHPGVILNKADLASGPELDELCARIRVRLPDAEIHAVSAHTGTGIAALEARLEKGRTYCFVGSSGVGKSSIINALFGSERLATAAVGTKTKRGRHVTTARALFVLDSGALVIDNPGMREFGILDSGSGIEGVFETIAEIASTCKFPDCTHTGEPKCAVREAIRTGTIDPEQFESYMKLKRENEFYEMSDVQRRKKDKSFGKFVKKALSEIEKIKT